MLSKRFEIAETEYYTQKVEDRKYQHLYKKIRDYVYPQLRSNPFFGPNIKKLKGEFEGVYRYRIGDYRLFYIIENDNTIIILTDLQARKDSYK